MKECNAKKQEKLTSEKKYIRPGALQDYMMCRLTFSVLCRKDSIIVIDKYSGIWMEWQSGQFKDTLMTGRFDFIINPFVGDTVSAYENRKEMMIRWIEKTIRKKYLYGQDAGHETGCP